jgi:hypothetical protein
VLRDHAGGRCNDPRRLIYGFDSRTNEMCGHGANAERHKLFFPYPENPVARRMCVTECPGTLLFATAFVPPRVPSNLLDTQDTSDRRLSPPYLIHGNS